MPKGFMGDSAWQGQRQPPSLIPECGRCGLYRGCHSPKMKPSGKGRRKVLIAAESPGEQEDERGIQLCGNAGLKLTQMLHRLGVNMRKDCILTNAIICRPPHNRDPKKDEVDWCRPNLTNAIREFNPDVIIPLGKPAIQSVIPLAWKTGEVDDVARWAGWTIPSQQLNAYICPTYHPSFLLRARDNEAAELIVSKHLGAAFKLQGKPYPNGLPNYKEMVQVRMDPEEAADGIAAMMAFGRPIAIDIETDRLKPDHPDSQILCCAVSDGRTAIAYPWLGRAVEQTKILLKSTVPKIAAMTKFEGRWFRRHLKIWPKWRHCTVVGAHWANCVHGITSVKFQSFVLFGTPDYDSHIEPYKKNKDNDSNGPNRMKELDPYVMLHYCGMDALLEHQIAFKQTAF